MYKNILIPLSMFLLSSTLSSAKVLKISNVEERYFKKINIKIKNNIQQNVHFGFSHTTGNIKSLNLNAQYDVALLVAGYDNRDLTYMLASRVYFSENDEIKNNEEYQLDMGVEQALPHHWFSYASMYWLRNPEFKNLDNRFSFNVGIGKEIYNNMQHNLKFKLGMAHNIENFHDTQETKVYQSLNEYIEYTNTINAHTNLSLRLGGMQNTSNFSKDYELLGVLALEMKITENLNIRIEEELYYDALPSLGIKKVDTKSLVSIGYNF